MEHFKLYKKKEKEKEREEGKHATGSDRHTRSNQPLGFIFTDPDSDREIKIKRNPLPGAPSFPRRRDEGSGHGNLRGSREGCPGGDRLRREPTMAGTRSAAPGTRAGAPVTGGRLRRGGGGSGRLPRRSLRLSPDTQKGPRGGLPSLLCDDHLRLVPVKFQPEWPVAQVDLSLAGNQPRLGGGELVERCPLVGMAILLGVRVARRGVALRRRVGQEAVISSVGDHRMMSHVAAGAGDGEGWVSRSMLAGIREHGTRSRGSRLGLAGLREQIAICSRSIETVTKLRDPVQDGREFISLDVPWCVLGVRKIVCI